MSEMEKEYQEFVKYIMNLRRFGKKKGIDVSSELLDAFNRPEKEMKIIHVAGTNGKGSVSAYIANCLMRLGLKVGLFTSPHLVDFNERIQVGCDNTFEKISHEEVLEIGKEILDKDIEAEPTMFDVCFIMAILKFKEASCDYVVLETGLGGTYDSTTAISCVPKACVITSIGLEHTAYLGDTIEQVASNKAGIFVKGSKIIIGKMPSEALHVMYNRCSELGIDNKDIVESWKCSFEEYNRCNKLIGYKKANAHTAIAALEAIIEADRDMFITTYMNHLHKGEEHCGKDCAKCANFEKMCSLSFDEWTASCINLGILGTTWEGRMEKLSDNVILDGAHNAEAFQALHEILLKEYANVDTHLIVGVLADKDYKEELDIIKPVVTSFMTATIDDVRAKSGEELAKELEELGCNASYVGTEEDVAKLVADLVKNNDANSSRELYNDLYVICGSLYFVGNVKRYLWQLQQE